MDKSIPAVYIVGFVSKKQLEESMGFVPIEKRRGGYLTAMLYPLPDLRDKEFITKEDVVKYIPQGWRLPSDFEKQKIKEKIYG